MRLSSALLALMLASVAFGQAKPEPIGQQPAVHPDVVIYIRQHSSGANLMEVSMVNPGYPADILRSQIESLCASLDFPARGLIVYNEELVAGNPKLKFLKAAFATSGLTEADGTVNLTPLARAFAGAKAPYTVRGMTVILDEFQPNEKTIKEFHSKAVDLHGRVEENPPAVEYQIALLSQNPGEIDIQNGPPPVEHKVSPQVAPRSNSGLIWALITLAGLSAGSLVYFLVSRRLSGGHVSAATRKL